MSGDAVELTDEKILSGLKQIKAFYADFVKSDKGSPAVRQFLENAASNEALLIRFLRGRKLNAQYAWETLKRHAEVRFDEYPEVFPETLSENVQSLLKDSEIFGVLKSRDTLGRRIMFSNMGAWDPGRYSQDENNTAIVHIIQKLTEDDDCINNGLVFIQQCLGTEMKHAKEFRVRVLRRAINVYWHSFPLKLKEVHFMNVPVVAYYVIRMAMLFCPNKLKERFFVSPKDLDYSKLPHCGITQDILPKCLGGELEFGEAVDEHFTTF